MQFEWHEPKSQECLELRGFDFDFASRVFEDRNIDIMLDNRKNYGEDRLRAFGVIDGLMYCVIFTKREDSIRIISARREHENSKDWRRYYGIS